MIISCDERMPPEETSVLALYKGFWIEAHLTWERPTWEETYEPFQYWETDIAGMYLDTEFNDITHWMELPPKPVLEEKEEL